MIGAWFPSILLMTRTPSGDRAEVRINGIPLFSRFRIISFVPSVICPSDVCSVPSMSLNTILQVFSFFIFISIFLMFIRCISTPVRPPDAVRSFSRMRLLLSPLQNTPLVLPHFPCQQRILSDLFLCKISKLRLIVIVLRRLKIRDHNF